MSQPGYHLENRLREARMEVTLEMKHHDTLSASWEFAVILTIEHAPLS